MPLKAGVLVCFLLYLDIGVKAATSTTVKPSMLPDAKATGPIAKTTRGPIDDEEEDYVPRFFGGRRNEGRRSGMKPVWPHQKPNTRSFSLTKGNSSVTEGNFTQKLNHFDAKCRRSWNQRYLMNDQYFNPNRSRPIIFVHIGGEGEIDASDVTSGPMFELAKKHGALLLALEHRYYGDSRPTINTNLENLRLLTSRQALADLNRFIRYIKAVYSTDQQHPRVITHGCSYSGSLAAWHKMKYPKIATGAVSQCAPMFPKGNLNAYFVLVLEATRKYSETCYNQTLDMFGSLHWLLSNHKNKDLDSLMNLCPPNKIDFKNPKAIDSLTYDLISRMMQAVQYNRILRGRNSRIGLLCDTMDKHVSRGEDSIDGYIAWLKQADRSCIVHDGRSIKTRDGRWEAQYVQSGTRQWLYQMCNEFGYFTTIAFRKENMPEEDGTTQSFSDILYFTRVCPTSFNISFWTAIGRIHKTARYYQPFQDKLSSVFFLIGGMDPWRAAGISPEYSTPMMPVLSVPDMSHCEEPSEDGDTSTSLLEAWRIVYSSVTAWLVKA